MKIELILRKTGWQGPETKIVFPDASVTKDETPENEIPEETYMKLADSVMEHKVRREPRLIETQNIFTIGGIGEHGEVLRSVEKYESRLGMWVPMPPMNTPRCSSSSSIVGNNIVACGGDTGTEITDTIETLDLQNPQQWITSPARLPVPLSGHQTVVYQGRLIAIGGHNGITGNNSNMIYEVRLSPPYSTNILCFMPQPRAGHGAELIGDEIYIFGGTRNIFAPSNDVLVYNLVTREFRVRESLPYAVQGMATVKRSDKVMLLGGIDQNEEELDQVIAYNPQTNEVHTMLPSMRKTRGGCCAVMSVMPDSIGGCSSERSTDILVVLGSLKGNKIPEYYDFRSGVWSYMAPMTTSRRYCTAVVSPVELELLE